MSKLHKEILTPAQVDLLPTIQEFSKDFGLVGGTAVALHIGHRESIDFDLFPKKPNEEFAVQKLRRKFARYAILGKIIVEEDHELTFMTINSVKVTFYHFQYKIPYSEQFGSYISIPSLLTLAAMKVFALGQRAKWKDYVDLYFIIRDFHPLAEIVEHAKKLFRNEFNEKLVRTQLSFFDDVSYKEPIVFKPGFAVPDEEIKRVLTEGALS